MLSQQNDTSNETAKIAEEVMKRFHIVKKTNIDERESLPNIANIKKNRSIIKKRK